MKFKPLSILLLAGLPLAQSFAGGPLQLNPNDPDNFTRWANGGVGIPFNPDQGGLGPLDNSAAVQQTVDAFQAWQDIPSATATYVNNGALPFDVDVSNFAPFIDNLFNGNNTSDGLSPIVYDEDGSIFTSLFGAQPVLGFASQDTFDENGVPIEGVSFLNGGLILDGFPLADFFAVQVHEFGHYSGLAHTVVNGEILAAGDTSGPTPNNTFGDSPSDQVETMFPFALEGGGQATPHVDDIGFFSTLYPSEDFLSQSSTITGMILGQDGVTPLTGVNVIARNVDNPFVDAVSAISGDRGVEGEYTLNGLTPGADYVLFVDQVILDPRRFSTTPIQLPNVEEFYNGDDESADPEVDDPNARTLINLAAGEVFAGANVIFNTFAPDLPLPLGDDDFIPLPLPFDFTMCGISYNEVFINSNGNVTFGAPSTSPFESAASLLSGPARIAGIWDDLDPSAGGAIQYSIGHGSFTISYIDVPEFNSTTASSFDIVLSKNPFGESFIGNAFKVKHKAIGLEDGISGYSCGNQVTSSFEEASDISASAPFIIESFFETAFFEQFDAVDNLLDLADSSQKYFGTRKFRDRFERNNSIDRARFIPLPFDSKENLWRYTSIDPIGNDVDYFKFRAKAGQTLLSNILKASAGQILGLFDSDGNLIATAQGSFFSLPRLLVEIPEDGKYFLAVSTFPDLDFSGDGESGGRYVFDAQLIDGTVLDLGDDDSVEVALEFEFPFQGESYTSVFVNSNGNLTFGAGDTGFFESGAALVAGSPRIAPLWDDLNPSAGGVVLVNSEANSATIDFIDVREFAAPTGNNFSVTLSDDGSIDIIYGELTATDGLAGISEGGGVEDPGVTDLSEAPLQPAAGTVYEVFDFFNNNDLANTDLFFVNE